MERIKKIFKGITTCLDEECNNKAYISMYCSKECAPCFEGGYKHCKDLKTKEYVCDCLNKVKKEKKGVCLTNR